MATLNTIRTTTLRVETQGAQQAKNDLNSVADAEDRRAKAATTTAIAVEESTRRQLSAGQALDRLNKQIDASYRAQESLRRASGTIDRAANQGLIDAAERSRLMDLAATRYAPSAPSAPTAANSNGRLQGYQLQNLAYQANDVVTSLASGISPMQTLAQQGGQIAQVFGGPGGATVRGAFAQATEAATGIAARIGIVGGAIAGVTTVALAGLAAFASYRGSQQEIEKSLVGIGRASGATAEQINALAPAAATAGNVSTRSARQMAGEFAATGKIGTEMYAGLISTAKDYAATTGQDLPDATKALAEAFADPEKGADALNKQLGFLNDTTRESIQRLQAQGDRLGAQRTLLDAYRTGLTSATELTSGWGRATAAVGATISDVWDKAGQVIDRVVTGGDLETRLATANKVLETSRARAAGTFGSILPGLAGSDVTAAREEVARLQAQVDKRDAASRQAQQNAISTRIGDIVRGLDPANEAIKKISDQAIDITRNLATLKFDEQGNARRAMEGLLAQAKQLREDLLAGGSGFADAVRAAQFGSRTVGFTQQGQSAAQIEENAANKGRDVLRAGGNQDDINARLQSIEVERTTLLRTLERQSTLDLTQVGGAFSRMSQSVQQQIVAAGQTFGKVPASLIAGIADKESGGNANIGGTKVLNAAGQPSTSAYGLGQITTGTARDAVRGGYLPSTFDRTDPSQGAAGIAGVLQMKLDQAGGDMFKALKNYYGSKDDGANTAYANDVLRRSGQMGDPSAVAQGREVDTNTRALRDQQQQLANVTENYGKNGLAMEASAEATRRYNALLDAGVPASDALAASIKGLATQTATAAQQIKLTQFASDVGFDREQLGRSSSEQNAYARARSVVGDTSSPAAQMVIDQQRLNDNLRETKGLATDAFGSFAQDIAHGTNAMTALSSMLGRISDKLLSMATDKLISNLFGSLLGGSGSGGGLMGLLGFGGGSGVGVQDLSESGLGTSAIWAANGRIPGYADGRPAVVSAGGIISGPGGPTSDSIPAWVSNREAIIRASAVEHYGSSFIKAINDRTFDPSRSNAPRYASGYVGMTQQDTVAAQSSAANANGGAPPINFIDQRAAGSGDIEPTTQRRTDGGFDVIIRSVEGRMGQRASAGRGPFKQAAGGVAYRQG